MLVTHRGEVYACGTNEHGELGCWNPRDKIGIAKPVLALGGRDVLRVACGPCHVIAIASGGKAFVWGQVLRFKPRLPASAVNTPHLGHHSPDTCLRLAPLAALTPTASSASATLGQWPRLKSFCFRRHRAARPTWHPQHRAEGGESADAHPLHGRSSR